MDGISDLNELLGSMKPEIKEKELVFCRVGYNEYPEHPIDPLMLFTEDEAITLVLPKKVAEHLSLEYEGIWTQIVLTVHSSLDAVGFLSKVTEVLAKAGISSNVVSAIYHDHIFVPHKRAKDALSELKRLSETYQKSE
ncbi:MAG: ACT domain-containing protein [Candidatus Thorarchaeota archaeon]